MWRDVGKVDGPTLKGEITPVGELAADERGATPAEMRPGVVGDAGDVIVENVRQRPDDAVGRPGGKRDLAAGAALPVPQPTSRTASSAVIPTVLTSRAVAGRRFEASEGYCRVDQTSVSGFPSVSAPDIAGQTVGT